MKLFYHWHCHYGRGHVGGDVLVSCGDVVEQWKILHFAMDSLELKLVDFSSFSTIAITAEVMMVVII